MLIECDSKKIISIFESKKINVLKVDNSKVSISINEKTLEKDIKSIISVFEEYENKKSKSIDFPSNIDIDSISVISGDSNKQDGITLNI